MADYAECVNDLREYLTTRQISDLLEAQAKRIAELEKREKHLEEMFHGWRDEAKKADARIAELEAALKPFADEASMYDTPEDEYGQLAFRTFFLVDHLRAARAALEKRDD